MKKYIWVIATATGLFIVVYLLATRTHEKVLSGIDFQIVRRSAPDRTDAPEAFRTDTLLAGKKNYLLLFTVFSDKHRIAWLPGGSWELKKEKIKSIGLYAAVNGHWTSLNNCITKGTSLVYGEYLNMDSNYGSIDEFMHEYNHTFSNEVDVHTSDLGERGICYELMIPGRPELSGEHVLRLELILDTGRKLEKERHYIVL